METIKKKSCREAVISENKPVSTVNSMQTLCWKPSYYSLLVKTAAQHSLHIRAQPIGRSNFARSFDLINTLLPLYVVVQHHSWAHSGLESNRVFTLTRFLIKRCWKVKRTPPHFPPSFSTFANIRVDIRCSPHEYQGQKNSLLSILTTYPIPDHWGLLRGRVLYLKCTLTRAPDCCDSIR